MSLGSGNFGKSFGKNSEVQATCVGVWNLKVPCQVLQVMVEAADILNLLTVAASDEFARDGKGSLSRWEKSWGWS